MATSSVVARHVPQREGAPAWLRHWATHTADARVYTCSHTIKHASKTNLNCWPYPCSVFLSLHEDWNRGNVLSVCTQLSSCARCMVTGWYVSDRAIACRDITSIIARWEGKCEFKAPSTKFLQFPAISACHIPERPTKEWQCMPGLLQ